ncbi:MAG: AmmeMemoRadiSam system protein A [Verrucomicrobia bacterium]|nr:AmmeMemoRadiSam system protein A [Verrucomicrobiota bacterium]
MTGAGVEPDPDLPEDRPRLATSSNPGTVPVLQRTPAADALSPGQRLFLLRLARATIEAAVHRQPVSAPDVERLDAPLRERRACFVTLEKHSNLRGCIGQLTPHQPLFAGVMDAARQAAMSDPRFDRVQPDELDDIIIEISVLSRLTPLVFRSAAELLDQLEPFRHGVVLQFEDRTSTFLPQVWDQIPDKADFLDRLARKGGWETSTWRDTRTRVSVYEVESFHESPAAL